MRLSDYEQHKMDEAYSAHMDAVEVERLRKADARLKADVTAYINERLARTSDPAFAEKLLIADRDFMVLCMCGFAAAQVTDALKELIDC